MVFLNNMLMILSHMVFNIPFDLIHDQCYPLHAKPTIFCFTFVLVIVNPIILFSVLKITWWELLVVNVLLKLLGISQAMNYFKVWLCFSYHWICEKCRLILTILLSYNFSWILLPRSLIYKNLNVTSNLVREFKFAKLDMLLKIKPDSGSICKCDKLKLWHFC